MIRNRIFDNSGNILLELVQKFNEWYLRRALRKNYEKFELQLEDSLGYMPTEKEILKFGQLRNRNEDELWFFWKGRYLFEWRG